LFPIGTGSWSISRPSSVSAGRRHRDGFLGAS
ncbi:hypothetical protein BAE44_0013125, partial [Dichanthelium oligosanthes]